MVVLWRERTAEMCRLQRTGSSRSMFGRSTEPATNVGKPARWRAMQSIPIFSSWRNIVQSCSDMFP